MSETDKRLQSVQSLSLTPDAPTCGNCFFGHGVDVGQVECRGLPPTPIPMPARDAVGNIAMTIQMMRPRLPTTLAGCALHRFRANGESKAVN